MFPQNPSYGRGILTAYFFWPKALFLNVKHWSSDKKIKLWLFGFRANVYKLLRLKPPTKTILAIKIISKIIGDSIVELFTCFKMYILLFVARMEIANNKYINLCLKWLIIINKASYKLDESNMCCLILRVRNVHKVRNAFLDIFEPSFLPLSH